MDTRTTRSRFATMLRKVRSPGHRRPALWRAGVVVLMLALTGACVDITRPNAPATKAPTLNISSGEGPNIGTDKQDYWPGQTVAIEGRGWTPGETVKLQVVHIDDSGDNSLPEHQPWDVVADADGYVSASWAIAEGSDEEGATLKLTADGATSGVHAEVTFTDLTGTVNLFPEIGRTNSQNAFQWNQTVYPRITSAGANTCYRLTWTDPSAAVTKTYHQTAAAGTTDPAGMAVNEVSGTWSLVVDQRAAGNCNSANDVGFGSATSPIFFDVARRVIVGAGSSSATDSPGGDQCVYSNTSPTGNNPSPPAVNLCQNQASLTMFVGRATANELRSYVRFDLSAASPPIPAGVNVTDAKVRLTVAGTVSGRTYRIQPADASWSEGTITYATQPGVTGTSNDVGMASALVPGGGGGDPQTWVKWPVTANVQGFLNGPSTNHGWRISDVSATTSASAGRFHTTEGTSGCSSGVTTCKRTWPVLLIDYSDPPKLEFYTPARTGIVGACLGPIQVQSKDFSGAVLPVGSNLTVNLSVTGLGVGDGAGIAGAGSFFSNNTCTTATTTTTITTGNSVSSAFYYRATQRGDGGHDVVASATGYTPNPSQTETINKAPTTLTYTGDRLVFVGNTFNFSGTITSPFEPCTENKLVRFRILPSPLDPENEPFLQATDLTDVNGVAAATVPTTNWIEDIYDGRMSTNETDDNCEVAKDDFTVSVLTPGGAATGGGFLAGNKVGGGRANFGFTIRPVEGSDPIAYKGQFLLIKQVNNVPVFRCKGAIDTYGTVSGSEPLLNVASGRCDFQVWNPALNGGEGGWEVPYGAGYTNRQFIFQFIDNGTGRGKDAPPPDQFGFSINFVGSVITDPSFPIADINGGNIDVKTGGTTSTSGTKGGGKKG